MSNPKFFFYLLLIKLCCLSQNAVHGQTALIKQKQAGLRFIKDSFSLVDNLNQIGLLYHVKDLDSCFHYAMKAKGISNRLHYHKGITDADNTIAITLFLRGLFKESLALFSKVLVAYQEQADTVNTGQVLSNISTVYNAMGDSAKSAAFSRRAFQMISNPEQDSTISTLYINYCLCNPALSDDSVRYYLDKSREIANRYKDERMLILAMQAQADRMLKKGQRQGVLALIKKSLDWSRNIGMEYFEINALWLSGDYYKDVPDSILGYYQQAYRLIEQMGYFCVKTPTLQVILNYTELSGNKEGIIRVQRLLTSALTAENENLKKFIGDYVRYNAIQDDNNLLETSNKNKQTKIWWLLAAFVTTAVLLILIFRQYRVSRRLNRKISEQNIHMQKALTDLEQSQADNTWMMKIVAHDLRNPVSALRSMAELMLEDPNRSAEDKTILELMRNSCESSLELISDLLQVQQRGEELMKESVDMGHLLHYCVELLHFKAAQKTQQILLQAGYVVIYANREKIWRVISNLITNAIKFSPVGADILVCLEVKSDVVIVTVQDNGIGIPAEMKEKIFDMFTRAKRTGTAGEQSYGLGLAISKQIVEAHGGSIWYESELGIGTTFFVELPLNHKSSSQAASV